MSFENRRQSMIIENEGCVAHMYLDSRGFVTVAVGLLLDTVEAAQKLALMDMVFNLGNAGLVDKFPV